ncbi:MAG: hypothetical protein R2810_04980 [Flavobacteriales bacterium]
MKLTAWATWSGTDGLLALMTIDNHYQDQIGVLLVEGNGFSAYTYPGGTWRDGIYRFQWPAQWLLPDRRPTRWPRPRTSVLNIGCGT